MWQQTKNVLFNIVSHLLNSEKFFVVGIVVFSSNFLFCTGRFFVWKVIGVDYIDAYEIVCVILIRRTKWTLKNKYNNIISKVKIVKMILMMICAQCARCLVYYTLHIHTANTLFIWAIIHSQNMQIVLCLPVSCVFYFTVYDQRSIFWKVKAESSQSLLNA